MEARAGRNYRVFVYLYIYLCICVIVYLCTCSFVYYTHICTLGEHVEVWVERRCQSYRCIYTRQSLQPFANGCSHIAAMCTNIINCFSKSHFSCAGLPSYDITGRQFEWFKIVKSKSQQLNSSQLNVCPGWGGGWGRWVLLLQMANAARSSAAGSLSLQPMHCIECKRRFWGRGRVITQVCTVCTLQKYALLGITGSPAST